ncbi:MAG: cell wall hydrolase, partial [Defluviitaleaceae bacterium]|nr:cell wall hydrolase [Defluviitaleaceae bacterium]
QSAINTILNPANQVSYHFVISREGEIIQAVGIENMAWANGTTNSGDNRDNRHSTIPTIVERRINANLYSVSIGFGDMPTGNPSEQQLASAVSLIRHIQSEVERIYNYTIPLTRARIIGHNEVTPRTRPDCPGRSFPFDELIRRLNESPTQTVPTPPQIQPPWTHGRAVPAGNDQPQTEISDWAIEAWEWATNNGLTDGTRPRDNITRQETVTLLHRLYGFIACEPGATLEEALPAPINYNPPSANRPSATFTDFEMNALCKMVEAEAVGEDDLGQRLVVHVILNRLASQAFPQNLLEVLFAPNQFSPVRDGSFNRAASDERVRKNVLAALSEPDLSQGAMWFNGTHIRATSWAGQNRTHIFDHGGHSFYK